VEYHRLAQRCGVGGDPRGLSIPAGQVGGCAAAREWRGQAKQSAWDQALRFSVDQFSAN
jgi:hypothetical protein